MEASKNKVEVMRKTLNILTSECMYKMYAYTELCFSRRKYIPLIELNKTLMSNL